MMRESKKESREVKGVSKVKVSGSLTSLLAELRPLLKPAAQYAIRRSSCAECGESPVIRLTVMGLRVAQLCAFCQHMEVYRARFTAKTSTPKH